MRRRGIYNAGVQRPKPSPIKPWLSFAASLLIAFGIWHWANAMFLPANLAEARAGLRPVGNNSDLYPRWLGAREALLHGRNPYSAEMTREIQAGFYGRPLDPRKPGDPAAREAFTYPLYVIFLLAPTVTLPFSTVQEIFRWLLLFCMAGSVPLWMHAIGFHARRWLMVTGMVLTLSSYPAVLEFHMQNLAVLVIFFLALAAAFLVRGWQTLSGFLLALATIKPEISWLAILWFLLWAASDYPKRKSLIWSFVAAMLGLAGAAAAVLPTWIGQFLATLREYPTYGTDPNFFQIFLPRWLATVVTVGTLAALFAMCWRWRKSLAGTPEFGWALAWVAVVTLAVLPKLAAYNQPLLLPALLVLIAHYGAIARSRLFPRALTNGAFTCQIWQWATALALSGCSWLVPAADLRHLAQLPVYTFIALSPMTLLAVVAVTFSRQKIAVLPTSS